MSDAFSPITTSRTLQTPQGYRIYTTQREVAAEYPLPTIGAAMSTFIAGFTGHYIMDVSDRPRGSRKIVTVTHGEVPSGVFTEYESVAYTFPPIYPNSTAFFPGGSRERSRVVTGRVTYEYKLDPTSAPTDWTALAAIWDYSSLSTGPFEVLSYILESAGQQYTNGDQENGLVGDFLNPSFIGVSTINDALVIYAPGDLYYNLGASSPSATTYAGLVSAKTELMASRIMHRWYCFYMLKTTWVKAQ
jgi:hypothetical protein